MPELNRRDFLRNTAAVALLGSLGQTGSTVETAVSHTIEPDRPPASRAERIARRAPRPPMGWNSWDAFGTQVKEAEVRAHADIMAQRLKPFGWEYIVVDIQWYESKPRRWANGLEPANVTYEERNASGASGLDPAKTVEVDTCGRLFPSVARFPSSAGGKGFGPLADYIHSKGLKFGIHIMRGVPRISAARDLPIEGSTATCAQIADPKNICNWNADTYGIDMSRPGAQAYYDSLVRLYASWGVDFIKADNMLDGPSSHEAEIEALAEAIDRCGRDIVLSLSPKAAGPQCIEQFRRCANMLRVTDDFWDLWENPKGGYPAALGDACKAAAPWAPLIQQGHWPDLDMLPLGVVGKHDSVSPERHTRLTPAEQTTMITLWCIARSPLMFGGDLMMLDSFTESLLTNPEVLAVQQSSSANREVSYTGDEAVWAAADPVAGATYVALFNRTNAPRLVGTGLDRLRLTGLVSARDLWARKDVEAVRGRLECTLPAHGAAVFRLGGSMSRSR